MIRILTGPFQSKLLLTCLCVVAITACGCTIRISNRPNEECTYQCQYRSEHLPVSPQHVVPPNSTLPTYPIEHHVVPDGEIFAPEVEPESAPESLDLPATPEYGFEEGFRVGQEYAEQFDIGNELLAEDPLPDDLSNARLGKSFETGAREGINSHVRKKALSKNKIISRTAPSSPSTVDDTATSRKSFDQINDRIEDIGERMFAESQDVEVAKEPVAVAPVEEIVAEPLAPAEIEPTNEEAVAEIEPANEPVADIEPLTPEIENAPEVVATPEANPFVLEEARTPVAPVIADHQPIKAKEVVGKPSVEKHVSSEPEIIRLHANGTLAHEMNRSHAPLQPEAAQPVYQSTVSDPASSVQTELPPLRSQIAPLLPATVPNTIPVLQAKPVNFPESTPEPLSQTLAPMPAQTMEQPVVESPVSTQPAETLTAPVVDRTTEAPAPATQAATTKEEKLLVLSASYVPFRRQREPLIESNLDDRHRQPRSDEQSPVLTAAPSYRINNIPRFRPKGTGLDQKTMENLSIELDPIRNHAPATGPDWEQERDGAFDVLDAPKSNEFKPRQATPKPQQQQQPDDSSFRR